MKLAAIYCVWDDWELFTSSFYNMVDLVDCVILIYSDTSNFNEKSITPPLKIGMDVFKFDCYNFEPDLNLPPATNERAKRNYGLDKARELEYTHFVMLDADEFYEREPFLKEKERVEKEDIAGLVCRVKTYFRTPTLTIGYDTTLVPFIHKITHELHFTWNTAYPYAFENRKDIRIDPTRMLNITSGVEMSEITMHHYSWCRSDIKKKIRNSTARQNIEKSSIVRDYVNAKPGYYCEFYHKTLEACENLFNIPDIIDENVF